MKVEVEKEVEKMIIKVGGMVCERGRERDKRWIE